MSRLLPAAAVMLTASLVAAAAAAAATIYVSPQGDDQASGRADQPLRTIAEAQVRARRLLRAGRSATVLLRGGVYYLDQPIVFTAADSGREEAPTLYAAAPQEEVVISGGRLLQLTWRPYAEGLLRAATPNGFFTDQLLVNGRREPLARYPDEDLREPIFQGYAADSISAARAAGWNNPAGGFLHAMHRSRWGDFHYLITGKGTDGQLQYEGGWQNNRRMGMHPSQRFVENIREELDAPREWFLDRQAGQLYYFPPADVDLRSARVEGVCLERLFEFRGTPQQRVRRVELRGLTLTHTTRTFMQNSEPLLRSDWTTYRGGAVLLTGTEFCAIRDCRLDQLGGNAIFVNQFNRGLEIVGNHISDAGASAISFVGDPAALRSPLFEYHETQTLAEMDRTPGPKTDNYPQHCLVEDNLICRNGRFEKQTAGVNLCMAAGITIRHNSIYDCPRAGVNICDGAFGGHLIEGNDVFDTVKETGDHGSFNSWGRDRFWHPDRAVTAEWVARFPSMPEWDCRETIVLRNNRWRCDHGWDIDLDDGSSNYEIYNNLCLNGGIKLREGYDRRVYNNVIVNNGLHPHVWYPQPRTRLEANIMWISGYRAARMNAEDFPESFGPNLIHQAGLSPRAAEAFQSSRGDDRGTLMGDALFLDPAHGDYRVSDGSPALAIGFHNFPMDRFGVRSEKLRKISRRPQLPPTVAAPPPPAPEQATLAWQGAVLKNLATAEEMSAVGRGETTGVLVLEVGADSPAARAGLRPGDVILALDQHPIRDLAHFRRLAPQPAAGRTVAAWLWRNQASVTLILRPGQENAVESSIK